MAGYLIINIRDIYLIAPANSALYRAESETIKIILFSCWPSWISCYRKKCSTLAIWHTLDLKSAPSNWPESIKKHYICRKTRFHYFTMAPSPD